MIQISKASKRKRPPVDGEWARYVLRTHGYTLADVARELGVHRSAITLFLIGASYSQRFWDFYFEKTKNQPLMPKAM